MDFLLLDRREPDRGADHDREERDEERDQHLRQQAKAEPDQEQWRDRDLGIACDETRSGSTERENAGHMKMARASGTPTTMLKR